MTLEPIPNELLGDDIYIQKPVEHGWINYRIYNVRVERSSSIESGYPDNPLEKTRLTVWIDCVNSKPQRDIFCGMRILYNEEIFDIVNIKPLRAGTLHHLKITAIKAGDHIP